MKAPKEIFIAETPDKLIWSDDPEKLKPYINVYRYLRKDVVDETIETAEDHAYFAGKEKLREELLEWAEAKKSELLNGEPTDVAAGINAGMDMIIKKLKSL